MAKSIRRYLRWIVSIVTMATLVWGGNDLVQAQTSLAISTGPEGGNHSQVIRDSRSNAYKRVEAILDRPSPFARMQTITGSDILAVINRQGITVFVDQTAIDDSWRVDEEFSVPAGLYSFRTALFNFLYQVNATFRLTHTGELIIHSLDNAQDPEQMTTIQYDVSSLVTSRSEADALAEMIQSANYDAWEDSGTGEGVVNTARIRGRVIFLISAHYADQRAASRLLTDTAMLSMARPVMSATPFKAVGKGNAEKSALSRPVELPVVERPVADRTKLRTRPKATLVPRQWKGKGGGGGVF